MCTLFIRDQVHADIAQMHSEFQDWMWADAIRFTSVLNEEIGDTLPNLFDIDAAQCGV